MGTMSTAVKTSHEDKDDMVAGGKRGASLQQHPQAAMASLPKKKDLAPDGGENIGGVCGPSSSSWNQNKKNVGNIVENHFLLWVSKLSKGDDHYAVRAMLPAAAMLPAGPSWAWTTIQREHMSDKK